MKARRLSVWTTSLLLSGLGTWAVFGQSPEKAPIPSNPPLQEKGAPPVIQPPVEGDPTVPGPALKEILNKNKPGPTVAAPKIELKGRVVGPRRPATALLDVGGKSVVVTADSQVTTPTMSLRVLSIDADAVVIEMLPSKEKLILR